MVITAFEMLVLAMSMAIFTKTPWYSMNILMDGPAAALRDQRLGGRDPVGVRRLLGRPGPGADGLPPLRRRGRRVGLVRAGPRPGLTTGSDHRPRLPGPTIGPDCRVRPSAPPPGPLHRPPTPGPTLPRPPGRGRRSRPSSAPAAVHGHEVASRRRGPASSGPGLLSAGGPIARRGCRGRPAPVVAVEQVPPHVDGEAGEDRPLEHVGPAQRVAAQGPDHLDDEGADADRQARRPG